VNPTNLHPRLPTSLPLPPPSPSPSPPLTHSPDSLTPLLQVVPIGACLPNDGFQSHMHHIHCLDTQAWLDNISKVIGRIPSAFTLIYDVYMSALVHVGREVAVGLFAMCSQILVQPLAACTFTALDPLWHLGNVFHTTGEAAATAYR